MRKTNYFKSSLMILLFTFGLTSAWGQMLLTEDFNYTLGSNLTANGWSVQSGGTTQPIDVVAGLSFTGYVGSGIGGAANVDNNGQDLYKTFTSQTTGTVYVSFLLKTQSTNAADYFFHLGTNPTNTSNFRPRLYITAGGNGIALSDNSTLPTSFVSITPGTTYLVVIKRNISSNETSLFVFDTLPTIEPSTPNQTYTGQSTTIGSVGLRQYSASQRQIVDGIRIANTWEDIFPAAVVYENGAWSATPTIDDDVIIRDYLFVGAGQEDSFEAKSLTIELDTPNSIEGALFIEDGYSVTLAGKIINEAGAANFVVASGANLIQDATYTTNDNEGEITVLRDSNPIKRLDYTLWSSPVTGQELQAFSPQTVSTRIYTYETTAANEATGGAYVVVPSATADFANAKGYLFRAPNDASATVSTPYEGEFVGVPFNGNVTSPVYSSDYTSVGNPYASNIEADAFLAANSNVAALYFWNNTGVAGANYSTCTLGNCVAASGGGVTPNGFITVGQGFLVETTAGSTVSFDNSMRVSNAGVFSKNDSEKNRIWLNLNNEQNEGLNQILVGYMAGATNNVDHQVDAKLFASETSALYNIIGEEKFVIQGKALPFETSDVVALGFKAAEAGKFNISLNNFDGLFAEGEVVVYLKDKELNITHNLMESAYAFESAAGEFNTRFEVVYEEEVMGTGDLNANAVQIYTSNDQIVVSSKSEKILSVELFDLQGRNIHTNNKVNASTYQIKSASKGVLVVKVLTQNGEVVTKKVINK